MTSRDIQPGEIIINEAPLIKGPAQVTGPVCLSCLKNLKEDDHSTCSKCGWPLCNDDYCHDSARHVAECDWTVNKRKQKVSLSDERIARYSVRFAKMRRIAFFRPESLAE